MKYRKHHIAFFFALMAILNSCNTDRTLVSAKSGTTIISDTLEQNSSVWGTLEPYRHEVNRQMNLTLVQSNIVLENKMPEGSMGNFAADALKNFGAKKSGKAVDIAIISSLQMKKKEIPAGIVTTRQVFEMFPSEDQIVVTSMKGSDLKKVFIHVLENRAAAMSAGSGILATQGSTVFFKINNRKIEDTTEYVVATHAHFLFLTGTTGTNSTKYSFTVRDAVIDEMKELHKNLKQLDYVIYGRIIIQ